MNNIEPADTIIRPIESEEELQLVHRLTHDCYVTKGYAPRSPDGRLAHYRDFDHLPETRVLIALRNGELVGSLSVTFDGPWGLTVEDDFRRICDSIRYSGRSLAVCWRLVVKDGLTSSRRALMDLIQKMLDISVMQGANTHLLTVNPRHQGVYQRLMNAKVVSSNTSTKGLKNAPGVLMRFDYENLPARWKDISRLAELSRAA